jgi:hypothetical protein
MAASPGLRTAEPGPSVAGRPREEALAVDLRQIDLLIPAFQPPTATVTLVGQLASPRTIHEIAD